MKWKYFLALLLAFSLLSPAFSESETELEIPSLEPEAEYIMKGEDILTLYQTIKDLSETKTEYQNLTTEMMTTLNESKTLAQEYEKENKKLTFQNNFLIGTTVCSIGICVVGAIVWAFTK